MSTRPASLAHRYALTLPGIATVTLGVKNRAELREALEAEAAGPLPDDVMDRIHVAIASRLPSVRVRLKFGAAPPEQDTCHRSHADLLVRQGVDDLDESIAGSKSHEAALGHWIDWWPSASWICWSGAWPPRASLAWLEGAAGSTMMGIFNDEAHWSTLPPDAMRDLITLFRYNTWANAKVFDLAAQQDTDLVKSTAAGTRDTVTVTLAHLASVEYAYLGMLEERPSSSREEVMRWAAHDLAWFPDQMRQIGASFVRLLESSTDNSLAAPLNVPWFDFALTRREGLIQVLSHSAQHRSQVLSWLSSQGIVTPDLDYVLQLRETREADGPSASK